MQDGRRRTLDSGEVVPLETGLAGALAGVALPGGGLAVAGPRLDDDAVVSIHQGVRLTYGELDARVE